MIQKYPILVGNYSYEKKKFLCEKIRRMLASTDIQIKDVKHLKYSAALKEARGNEAISQDIDSEYYGWSIETVFFLSSNHDLYNRLKESGFQVISTDTLLRNFEKQNMFTRMKQVGKKIVAKTKEKTRRPSHARYA